MQAVYAHPSTWQTACTNAWKTYHIMLHVQYSLPGDEHKMFETRRRRRICYLVKEQHLQTLRRLRKGWISRCLHLPATRKTKSCVTSWSNIPYIHSTAAHIRSGTLLQHRDRRERSVRILQACEPKQEKIWGLRREASSVMLPREILQSRYWRTLRNTG